MENRRKKTSSGDKFSFAITPVNDQFSEDFEFDSSPADHLFFNGKLLPHTFPFQPSNNNAMLLLVDQSRRASRTSSISSKDSLSLMSSRSNSTNSRSSTSSCSSARTSYSSDNSERKLMYHYYNRTTSSRTAQLFGHSQRWQFITPVPASLTRDVSANKKKEGPNKGNKKKRKKVKTTVVSQRRRLCRRFFRWLVSTCVKCHAMEPSKKKSDVVDHVNEGNHVKMQ